MEENALSGLKIAYILPSFFVMRDIVFKWLTLDAQTYTPWVWYGVVALWCGLVILSLTSVAGQPLSQSRKMFWGALIIFAPFAGLLAYCVYCLTKVDYHLLEFLVVRKSRDDKKMENSSRQTF